MSIQVQQLTKVYDTQVAVNDISFSVEQGEIVGFLGPNGAGKSTTLKMISGYLPMTKGKIFVSGIDIASNPIAAQRKIGYLAEQNPLYMDMYVKEYLQFVASVHKLKNRKKAIEEIIEVTGLSIEQNKKIYQLSKGYKQRVGLAAALLPDPEIILLDEPINGLDPNQILEIRELIKKLGKTKTILFSSHILQEVQAVSDRVIIIDRGNLIADGSLQDVLNLTKVNTIEVKFDQSVEEKLLQSIPSVSATNKLPNDLWQLQTNDIAQLQKEILSFSLQNQFNILSLKIGNHQLEDVFINLTKNKNIVQKV